MIGDLFPIPAQPVELSQPAVSTHHDTGGRWRFGTTRFRVIFLCHRDRAVLFNRPLWSARHFFGTQIMAVSFYAGLFRPGFVGRLPQYLCGIRADMRHDVLYGRAAPHPTAADLAVWQEFWGQPFWSVSSDKLPYTFQRSMSFLPLKWNPTWLWMRKAVRNGGLGSGAPNWPKVPEYLLLGKGYGLSKDDFEDHRPGNLCPLQYSHMSGDEEALAISGDSTAAR